MFGTIKAMKKTIIAVLFAIIVIPACGDGADMKGSTMTDKQNDDSFADVIEGSYSGYDCSPKIEGSDFRGIKINAPKVVKYTPGVSDPIYGGFAKIIVCATYEFGFEKFDFKGDVEDFIVFVAVDEQSLTSYSGTMTSGIDHDVAEFDDDELSLGEPLDPIAGYLNPNLAVIMNLPEKDADYIVYAVLQQYESNRVRISVRSSEE